jgi:FAD/FMN-containing dehydrogenase
LSGPIADFSGLRWSSSDFEEAAPRSAEELCRIVRSAYAEDRPVRIRGQGHSLNGSSLPLGNELLLRTGELRDVHFAARGSVTAGCGTVLWVLQSVLRAHGFDLPVLNDGYPGPTVGGYLAAGGFGPDSKIHGGFWNNVVALKFVDGTGRLREVAASEPLFPWLFGSMGQLGILVEATLAIVALQGPARYPAGQRLRAPQLAEVHVPLQFAPRGDERLFWFTLFVPDEELAGAQRELLALEARHAGALRFAERYCYPIRHRGMVAPLVYPEARPFTATGAWGWLGDASREAVEKLLEFDRGFMTLAMSRPGYRRYIQSELPAGPQIYEQCFGPAIYAEFRRIKSDLDPKYLLNRGSVFAR